MSEWWRVYGMEVVNGVTGCAILLSLAAFIYFGWPNHKGVSNE